MHLDRSGSSSDEDESHVGRNVEEHEDISDVEQDVLDELDEHDELDGAGCGALMDDEQLDDGTEAGQRVETDEDDWHRADEDGRLGSTGSLPDKDTDGCVCIGAGAGLFTEDT